MHSLPDLPYNYSDLEPHIDEETMRIHHLMHHAGYVSKLNDALKEHKDLSALSLKDLLKNLNKVPENIRQSVTNNAGGHANHFLFWQIMSPTGGGEPKGELMDSIKKEFDSFESFKEEFTKKALSVFGSGWVFLVLTPEGNLQIKRHSFQNSPITHGNTPILALDVWEHAYYLKYKNKRADYIKAWWNTVSWSKVSQISSQTQK